MDDFTRFTWVHLLKYKSEVPSVLDSFFHYVETQFNAKVQTMRSDNAIELTKGFARQLFAKRGIVH